ncbi:hypothetical protein [Micromonospora sp. NPDC005710]|uniref:hypothetical protein n=1 Tax=Micromonospora sp. NPDC005710 TaxID=3157051 RepID=UPI0033EA17A5
MTHPQAPQPSIPPDTTAAAPLANPVGGPTTFLSLLAMYLLVSAAAVFWAGAAYSARMILLGNDMVEGMLSFVGLLALAASEGFALLFTITAAFELRARDSPRAALAAGLVAVTGVVATIIFLVWASTTASTAP